MHRAWLDEQQPLSVEVLPRLLPCADGVTNAAAADTRRRQWALAGGGSYSSRAAAVCCCLPICALAGHLPNKLVALHGVMPRAVATSLLGCLADSKLYFGTAAGAHAQMAPLIAEGTTALPSACKYSTSCSDSDA